MTLREAFEAWISRPPFEADVSRWPDDASKYGWPGNYKKLDVQLAWCAWLDSRAYALTQAAAHLAGSHQRSAALDVVLMRDAEVDQ